MAGHKRPFGVPICPDFDEPLPPKAGSPIPRAELIIPVLPPGGFFHHINPNYIERNPLPLPSSQPERADSPMTWVSTEPADDVPVKREPVTYVDEFHHHRHVRVERSQSVTSSVTSSSSYIRRIQHALSTSTPLASMFRTPRQDISGVTKAARAEGLYTALIHQPRPIYDDAEPSSSTSRMSWRVVVGQDAGQVAELADMYERDTMGGLGVPPPVAPSLQSWVARYTVKCMIGGFTLWIFLWAFFMIV
ncbi:hypothetical protein EUX98_g3856 [Antrodiella citrinella]|uniref:Uncharacterized protein n=1 Tax=Antrodiella citrinella TaxID=2447956 RepID=A0A4S4MVI6_9APHY|nr:hypothetical protein EUX98_g3856 [Antrodiella citrinella]